ncbi:MAG: hypothetical protein SXA11_19835, partial [Cyanobacteriota bacterium]|nr:hypothetical protein [Cyanobacteriota bacterium]
GMDSRTGILPVIRLEQPFVGWVEREPFVGWVERQRNPTLGGFVLLPLMLGCAGRSTQREQASCLFY